MRAGVFLSVKIPQIRRRLRESNPDPAFASPRNVACAAKRIVVKHQREGVRYTERISELQARAIDRQIAHGTGQNAVSGEQNFRPLEGPLSQQFSMVGHALNK